MTLQERKETMEAVQTAEESLKRLRYILYPKPIDAGQFLYIGKFGSAPTKTSWTLVIQATDAASAIVATILQRADVKEMIIIEAKRVYDAALAAESRMLEERHMEIPQDRVEMDAEVIT